MARHLIFLILVFLAGCGGRDEAMRTPIILISIDTLRSDHLPAYGYDRIATPNIDALRKDSILYERAYSHCPLTLPSHATVFTGQLPAETGIRDNTGYALAKATRTLGEILSERGYATGAAVSAYVMRKGSGIERGFASYDDDVDAERAGVTISAVQRRGAETVAAADRWLSANSNGPLFYFLHLYEPHTPYEPTYDAEITTVDSIVGTFLQRLKDLRIYDEALIILFSDHGEGLNDHGEDEHGIFLYREALQVPLFVKLPRGKRAGESIGVPVQLSDIFPTVVAAAGVEMPSPSPNVHSLLDPPAGRQIYSETYFPRFHFGWSDLHSLIDAEHHFIEAPQPELYEIADAAEKRNVVDGKRRIVASMRRSIEPLIRKADAPAPVDPEEAAKLAALGYLGSAAASQGPLPDPKTKTGMFREIREAFKHFKAGRYEEALEFYQRLLRENPRMVDLWDVSARAQLRLGRPEEAIASAQEALRLSPQSTHLALFIATVAVDSKRLDVAKEHAELALRSHPADAHQVLARVALARGDVTTAEREARAARDADPNDAGALVTLARVEKQKGNLEQALQHLDAAVAGARSKNAAVHGLHFLRGDVLARLGRSAEAEKAFREEMKFFPEDAAAYTSLVVLYTTDGRLDEATRVIFDLEKASPTPPSYAAISETLRVIGDQRGARFWALKGLKRFPKDETLRRLVG